jgi:TetR/AcrR family transcriptional regulator
MKKDSGYQGAEPRNAGQSRALRDEKLLETSARLFNRYGYHGTSVSMLAEALGITKSSLYHFVGEKSDLLYMIHQRSITATWEAIEQGVAEGHDGYSRLEGMIRNYLRRLTSSPIEMFLLLEDGVLEPERAEEIRGARRMLNQAMTDQIVAGIKDGSITRCEPRMATFTIVGALAWVTKWHDPSGEWDSEKVSVTMAEILARMLKPA